MALANLAVVADLSARGIDTSNATLADTMLRVASATVRRAAGSPILSTTSTVDLTVWDRDALVRLPGLPVVSVASVAIDGDAVTDHKLTDLGLWRAAGWGYGSEPVTVTVTYTHGLTEVPADVVDLVCNLAARGMAEAPEGARDPRVVAERIDDYSVTFAQGAEAVASVMELPRGTRRWLRASFGNGAGMVRYR